MLDGFDNWHLIDALIKNKILNNGNKAGQGHGCVEAACENKMQRVFAQFLRTEV